MKAGLTIAVAFCLQASALHAEAPQTRTPRTTRAASGSQSRDAAVSCRTDSVNGWWVHETENFRLWSQADRAEGRTLIQQCATYRTAISGRWFPESEPAAWKPRCEIVVHETTAGYNRALGRRNDQSVGCTTLRIREGRTIERRIDLRSNTTGWKKNTLPHELTHVVLAEHLDRRRLPSWADEGIAVLSESPNLQQARLRELWTAWTTRQAVYPVSKLLSLNGPPAPRYRAAFYGQSATLVAVLLEQGTPAEFVRFLRVSRQHGRRYALQHIYDIADAAELQDVWLAGLRSGNPLKELALSPAFQIAQKAPNSEKIPSNIPSNNPRRRGR